LEVESLTGLRKASLIVTVLAIGGTLGYVNLTSERATGPEVEVEAVERRNLEAIVSASGTIEPKLSVDISASTMGRVTRLAVSEGDRVESGQFLLEIDPEVLRAAVDRGEAGLQASRSTQRQAEVSVQSARVNLELSRDSLERQENLWELRLISRETYEIAESDVTLRETELEAREVEVATQAQRIRQEEANLDSARYELTKVTITAPITGVVTRRNIEEGETVVVGTMNNQGTVLATIADLSVIEAEVEVDETDIPSVELGQTAEVTIDALPDRHFAGVVTEIGNSPIQTTASGGGGGSQATTFKVIVTLKNEIPNVRPGFTCTADITTAVRLDSLAIPIQATTIRQVMVGTDGDLVRADPGGRSGGIEPAVSAAELPDGSAQDPQIAELRQQVEASEDPEVRQNLERMIERLESEGDEATPEASLPTSAALEEELEGVFVTRQGRAVFIPVVTGIAGERYFEALTGVREGDLVITGPFSEVRNLGDGDAIRVVDGAEEDVRQGGLLGGLRGLGRELGGEAGR